MAIVLSMAILHLGPISAGAVLTGLEKNHYQQPTSSAQIIDFMSALASSSDAAQSIILTRSASGHPLGAILISSDIHEFMTGKRNSDKLTVMLIGSQHGRACSADFHLSWNGAIPHTPGFIPRAYVIRTNQKLLAELLDRHHIAYSTQALSIPAAVELRPVELPPEAAVSSDCKGPILAEDKSGQKYSFQPGDLIVSVGGAGLWLQLKLVIQAVF